MSYRFRPTIGRLLDYLSWKTMCWKMMLFKWTGSLNDCRCALYICNTLEISLVWNPHFSVCHGILSVVELFDSPPPISLFNFEKFGNYLETKLASHASYQNVMDVGISFTVNLVTSSRWNVKRLLSSLKRPTRLGKQWKWISSLLFVGAPLLLLMFQRPNLSI